MKLVDMPVKDYLNILSSDAPAPGGGSVSALSAAQGAALVAMVCDLTIPKEKYSQHRDLCVRVKDDILSIYDELIIGIDKDTEAFNRCRLPSSCRRTQMSRKLQGAKPYRRLP